MLADTYDVILIGESLPGLITSALLARRGHRVLVLEPVDSDGTASPVFKSDGFIFPKGPLLFLGLHREGLYEKIFSELGLSLSLLKKEGTLFGRPVPPFQLLLPTHRLNFFSKWEEFLDELRREFPEELQAVRAFTKTVQETGRILEPFHHLPFPQWRPSLKDRSRQFFDLAQYWSTLRRLKGVAALDYVHSQGLALELQKLLELISLFFYQRPLSDLRALDLVSLLNLAHHEVVEVREGWSNLAKIFISRLKEYRGEFLRDIKLGGIIEESGEVRGVKLEGDRVIKGRVVLVSLPLRSLMIQPGPQRDGQEHPRDKQMRSYTMFFGIDEEVVPSAMMDHLLFTSDLGRPLEAENFLYLYLTPRGNPGPHGTDRESHGMDKGSLGTDRGPLGTDKWDCPRGKRGLRVTCLVPLERPMLPSDREALRKAVLNHLVWLMPFSEGRMDYLGEDLEDSETSSRLADFLSPSHKLKETRRYGTKFYTTSLQNLFLLPGESRSLAATQEGVKSGWDLAQHLSRWLAAELRRR